MLADIREFMVNNEDRMVELQELLTSIPAIAPESGGDGESEKAKALLEWLENAGFEDIELYGAPDKRVSSGVRPSIAVTVPGKSQQNIWIMAHMDVVPVGDLSLWDTNPWKCTRKDGKLYGRGCEDNQQGLISAAFAALYFVENEIVPEYNIKLLFVADEENGSQYGCIWLAENTDLFKSDDLVIIPDGGDSRGETIEIAEKNILWLKFDVHGKQAHGSRPDTGSNACLAASDLVLRIHQLENRFNRTDPLFKPDYSTLQPTKHDSNVDSINIIPGEDTICMDCRIIPVYTNKEVLREVDGIVEDIEDEYDVSIDYSIPQQSESPQTPEDSPIVQMLSDAIMKSHGQETELIGIGGGTVAGDLRRHGIDCAVWSTLDSLAHQPNEYCVIENMIRDAITLAAIFEN
ncbi:MAG: M20 family metallo-hydrolase [Methanobrevibacter sp.]|uniref:M20 family metallo-hydrolase n=1 Tax=Methanobrevibacter sp. TaxID=66852 RepID=UPI0026E0F2D1|nr:M20 family metallo-hydrolase [Methanobrevibacter sp.]MDO5849435.1 M20 family metallo-hydrolase [Methanobrevibacter sp.]